MRPHIINISMKKSYKAGSFARVWDAVEIRLEWSNDRNHFVRVNSPHDRTEVVKAFEALLNLVATDPFLEGGELK